MSIITLKNNAYCRLYHTTSDLQSWGLTAHAAVRHDVTRCTRARTDSLFNTLVEKFVIRGYPQQISAVRSASINSYALKSV